VPRMPPWSAPKIPYDLKAIGHAAAARASARAPQSASDPAADVYRVAGSSVRGAMRMANIFVSFTSGDRLWAFWIGQEDGRQWRARRGRIISVGLRDLVEPGTVAN
jgi:hypothetical protein